MGIDIAGALKAIVVLVGLILGALGVRKYGKAKEDKGRQDGIKKMEEVTGENYKDLAADVLDGGHPYGVRQPDATEIAYPEPDSRVRLAPDVHGNGEKGGSDGDSATTS